MFGHLQHHIIRTERGQIILLQMAERHHQDEGALYLFDSSFDQKTRKKVGEVPALLGFSTGLAGSQGGGKKADHAPFVLHFFHWRSHILTNSQLCSHNNTHTHQLCDDIFSSELFFLKGVYIQDPGGVRPYRLRPTSSVIPSYLPGCSVGLLWLSWAGRLWFH